MQQGAYPIPGHPAAAGDQLLKHAQGKNANQDVLDALRDVPDRQYEGPNEVSKAVAK